MFKFLTGWKGYALAAGLAMAIGFTAGWQVQGWKKDARQARGITQDKKTAQKLTVESAKIETKKQEQLQQTRIVYRTIRERINDAPDHRVCFDDTAVRVWNDAIAGADLYRPEPAGAARETDPAENVEATTTEILNNAANNYETCNANSIKHNALIDKIESLQGKMCVCGNG
ncbi:hypothetical protein IHQ56_02805 [Methylobacillus flagellatus]|uniref:hypothetical protein n=1 Tax=Methylobacillus flagellatus TaxID=405 RepID=UPI00285396D0|nr:hypothetical protein [Methylobacillus flagellatus]MDR5170740.1 hypothetical protein [Methylobacillus flagellatus]